MSRRQSRDHFSIDRLIVTVDEIEPGGKVALVTDEFNRSLRIRTDYRRGKGAPPRPGEVWMIDQTMGPWTFAACIRPDPPVITGSTDNNPALVSLIAMLAEAGIIIDQTTNTQIRANLDHSHPYSPLGHSHG